jgi:hypothetical protein
MSVLLLFWAARVPLTHAVKNNKISLSRTWQRLAGHMAERSDMEAK